MAWYIKYFILTPFSNVKKHEIMFDSFFQIGQFLDISCGTVQEGERNIHFKRKGTAAHPCLQHASLLP